jgi:hypothetical protein
LNARKVAGLSKPANPLLSGKGNASPPASRCALASSSSVAMWASTTSLLSMGASSLPSGRFTSMGAPLVSRVLMTTRKSRAWIVFAKPRMASFSASLMPVTLSKALSRVLALRMLP